MENIYKTNIILEYLFCVVYSFICDIQLAFPKYDSIFTQRSRNIAPVQTLKHCFNVFKERPTFQHIMEYMSNIRLGE